MGDPAGVGPEVLARAREKRVSEKLPTFVAIGDAGAVEAVWDGPIARINDIQNTIASAVEEQSATTNEIARNASEAALGANE